MIDARLVMDENVQLHNDLLMLRAEARIDRDAAAAERDRLRAMIDLAAWSEADPERSFMLVWNACDEAPGTYRLHLWPEPNSLGGIGRGAALREAFDLAVGDLSLSRPGETS